MRDSEPNLSADYLSKFTYLNGEFETYTDGDEFSLSSNTSKRTRLSRPSWKFKFPRIRLESIFSGYQSSPQQDWSSSAMDQSPEYDLESDGHELFYV